MKSNQNEEVQKLADYTAKRILDDVLAGRTVIDYKEVITGSDIYQTLKKGTTRDMIYNNLDLFDTCLNNLIYNRVDYLCAEGLLTFDNEQCYRIPTEAEMEEFLTID
jgi:hypothetical protein